jgi:hypothetical protein
MKTEITLKLDVEAHTLEGYTDAYIAQLWHIAQANPAPTGDHDASELVDMLKYEIVRRWLSGMRPELYRRQASENYRELLMRHGHWKKLDPTAPDDPLQFVTYDGERRVWVPEKAPEL